MTSKRWPIVVVGGGVAGMVTALAAAPRQVCLLQRATDGGDTASALAQGGLAAAMDPGDSAASHARDTMRAGAGHNHASMVRWLCRSAPEAIAWLIAQGVEFDCDASGGLSLGREGGHLAARIVHACGDASGAALVRTLAERVRQASHVHVHDAVEVESLLCRGDAVCGVGIRDACGRSQCIEATSVVLATGGIGALFAQTSNPSGADGSGLSLGLAAGANVRDLEFVQFHPTALAVPGAQRLPLITEALRGAGAVLQHGCGRGLMLGRHPLGDLAPRDVLARRVWRVQREEGGVWLDARAVPGDWSRRFPTVLAACLGHGMDPRRERIPVTAAAHFHMGGLAVDADGRTRVSGLHAVGEVACNGVHGANRLASNSLLEGVLCGLRLGHLLARATGMEATRGAFRWVTAEPSLAPDELVHLRRSMWRAAGPVRSAASLREGLEACTGRGRQAALARRLLRAAWARRESLGAHCRDDSDVVTDACGLSRIRERMLQKN